MFAPMVDAPETLKVLSPLATPPKDATPVTTKAFVPPAIVEPNVTVVPVNVRVAADPVKVTAPL